MKYIISKEAERDLEKIWIHTFEKWSLEQADRYLNLIINEIEYCCIHPNSGVDISIIRKGYHRIKVKSHFIYFKMNSKLDELQVIRILHEIMDIDKHIDE
jgi:toxin ParE1/3/4